ncbi:MAG: ATP-binding cassette domain-containing protein [Christensenellales bacterium]
MISAIWEDKERRKAYLHPGKKRLLPTLWRMYKPVRQSPRILAACVGYALSNGVLPLLGVLVTYVLVGLLSSSAANPQTMFMAAGIYALAFFLCSALSNQLNNRNYTWFTWLRLDYLNRINAKLMTMDLGLFENSAFMDDVQTGFYSLNGNNDGLEGYYHKIFESGGTLVSVLLLSALLALQSPLILLASLAVIVIGLAAKTHLVKLRYRHQEDFMRHGRRLRLLGSEAANFQAGKDLRLYNMAGHFKKVFEPVFDANMRLHRMITGRELTLSFLESMTLAALDIVCACVLVNRRLAGAISTAEFVMLLSATVLYAQTILEFTQQLSFIKAESLYVQDTFNILEAQLSSLSDTGKVPGEGPVTVRFEEVSFSYPGSDRLVLDNLSFEIKAGERCALVGLNGAGKTTLVKLLLGLYQPTSGQIYINDVNI